jgi:hypothetical protein
MAFAPDVKAAARRTLVAAEALNQQSTRGVAGYLYGIAAECAIKALMASGGPRIDEAFYQHFPDLRQTLRDTSAGRLSQTLTRFIQDDAFMNNWHVSMRYAGAGEIAERWIDTWARQARGAVSAIGA